MLTSIILAAALAGAAPQSVAPTGQPSPATTGTHPVPKVSNAKHKAPRTHSATKPPLTTATGTTTPKPSDPAGTVPPGAPGTSDPTMPGSPPH